VARLRKRKSQDKWSPLLISFVSMKTMAKKLATAHTSIIFFKTIQMGKGNFHTHQMPDRKITQWNKNYLGEQTIRITNVF
jgi:hypothetical protein